MKDVGVHTKFTRFRATHTGNEIHSCKNLHCGASQARFGETKNKILNLFWVQLFVAFMVAGEVESFRLMNTVLCTLDLSLPVGGEDYRLPETLEFNFGKLEWTASDSQVTGHSSVAAPLLSLRLMRHFYREMSLLLFLRE